MTVTSSGTNGFLFADLRDYTRYVEAHGDRAAAALLDAYRTLVRATVAEFGGAEIKTEGDSFYVVFPSASSAVQCGLAILAAAAQSTAASGGPISVGIGVHAGETVETVGGLRRLGGQRRGARLQPGQAGRTTRHGHRPRPDADVPARPFRRPPGAQAEGYRGIGCRSIASSQPMDEAATVPAKPVTGVRRRSRSAVLLVGLLIGGAAAGYVLLAATRPPVGPSVTATPAAEATFSKRG